MFINYLFVDKEPNNHPLFHLPLHRNPSNNDAGYDPGYASERSPEDELPPPLPLITDNQYTEMMQNLSTDMGNTMPNYFDYSQLYQYDFITKGKTIIYLTQN